MRATTSRHYKKRCTTFPEVLNENLHFFNNFLLVFHKKIPVVSWFLFKNREKIGVFEFCAHITKNVSKRSSSTNSFSNIMASIFAVIPPPSSWNFTPPPPPRYDFTPPPRLPRQRKILKIWCTRTSKITRFYTHLGCSVSKTFARGASLKDKLT